MGGEEPWGRQPEPLEEQCPLIPALPAGPAAHVPVLAMAGLTFAAASLVVLPVASATTAAGTSSSTDAPTASARLDKARARCEEMVSRRQTKLTKDLSLVQGAVRRARSRPCHPDRAARRRPEDPHRGRGGDPLRHERHRTARRVQGGDREHPGVPSRQPEGDVGGRHQPPREGRRPCGEGRRSVREGARPSGGAWRLG